MTCIINFYTNKREYITNKEQLKCENINKIYKWLKDFGGLLSTKDNFGFDFIDKFYLKWYNIINQHEYSGLNNFEDLEFKFSIEYKNWYTYEPSYCIECSFCLNIEQPRLRYIRLHFNILLDSNLNILGIDPCCNSGIIITKCILQFNIKDYKELLFYNEI